MLSLVAESYFENTAFFAFMSSDLFIQKLPCVLLYVSFIQVGGQTHQTYSGQAKVSQLDVAHWGNQEAKNRKIAELMASYKNFIYLKDNFASYTI